MLGVRPFWERVEEHEKLFYEFVLILVVLTPNGRVLEDMFEEIPEIKMNLKTMTIGTKKVKEIIKSSPLITSGFLCMKLNGVAKIQEQTALGPVELEREKTRQKEIDFKMLELQLEIKKFESRPKEVPTMCKSVTPMTGKSNDTSGFVEWCKTHIIYKKAAYIELQSVCKKYLGHFSCSYNEKMQLEVLIKSFIRNTFPNVEIEPKNRKFRRKLVYCWKDIAIKPDISDGNKRFMDNVKIWCTRNLKRDVNEYLELKEIPSLLYREYGKNYNSTKDRALVRTAVEEKFAITISQETINGINTRCFKGIKIK
jgi:hypothetical protein